MVALQFGHRAITIDVNSEYIREARERLAGAPAAFEMDNDDQDGDGLADASASRERVHSDIGFWACRRLRSVRQHSGTRQSDHRCENAGDAMGHADRHWPARSP